MKLSQRPPGFPPEALLLLDHLPPGQGTRIVNVLMRAFAAGLIVLGDDALATLAVADLRGIRGLGPAFRRLLRAVAQRALSGSQPLVVLPVFFEWAGRRGEVIHIDCPCGKGPHPPRTALPLAEPVTCDSCHRRFRVGRHAVADGLAAGHRQRAYTVSFAVTVRQTG